MATTALAVETIKPTDDRQEIACGSGLFLIVQPSGAKSWAYRGRVNGKWKKIRLGDFPDTKLTAARALAGAARASAHAGRVLVAPKPGGTPEAAPEVPEGRSVSDIWKQYCTLRMEPECKPATIAEHARIFKDHIEPVLGARDIVSITKADLLPIADAALARGFAARNKTIAVLTGFFTWAAEERDLIDKNPTRGIKQRAAKETNSKRALDDAEIKAFWKACAGIDAQNLATVRFGAMFKLMLLTGARRNEVAGMSDAEIKDNVWTIPEERAKNGKPLPVHLTKTAQAILKSLPRVDGCAFLFGPTGERCGFGFSKAKDRLDSAAEKITVPWRLHDLRRTFRTGLGKLGIAEEIAERCINHPPGSLKAVYDRHKYEKPMAEAWKAWEGHVLKLARAR
jgi:integrase